MDMRTVRLKSHRKRYAFLTIFGLSLLWLPWLSVVGTSHADAGCPAWAAAASPNNGPYDNVLYAVSAASPSEAWAVGYTAQGDGYITLAMHWDGRAWSLNPSPNPGQGGRNSLDGVATLASNNVWAVGNSGPADAPRAFVLHWDGSQWNESQLPQLDSSGSSLYAISARAPDDIWAVGSIGNVNSKTERSLIMHYNGVDWSVTPVNVGGYADALFGVSTRAPNDAWAVGYRDVKDAFVQPLAVHWDGTQWSVTRWNNGVDGPYVLNAVVTTGANDVWGVGYYFPTQNRAILVTHWDGTKWTRLDVSTPSPEGANLFGISAASSNDIWGVGYLIASGVRRALFMHYDGAHWTQVNNGDVGPGATLYGVAAVGSGDPIAVGYSTGEHRGALVERYADACAPPTPTATAAPPTSTATPAPVQTVPIPGTRSRVFPETGRAVSGLFLDYWESKGGLAQQGYPISEVLGEISPLDHKPYTVQYFERAVFEYHPENQQPYNVLLSQLGTFRYKQKYPNGAPGQMPNQTEGRLFPETNHWIGGKFLAYWQTHGGLAQQGYPISDEFTEVSDLNGKPFTVQYFERAVFELHPENQPPYDVLLSQLGTFQYRLMHG